MSGKRIIAIGDVMTDIIVVPEGPIVRGSDRRAGIRSKPGGSGANQAVWLGALGAPVSFVARVGATDKPHLEAYFKGFHVVPILTADPQKPSGKLVTIVDPDGERSFLTDRGANLALSPSDMPVDLLEETGLLLISGYSLFAEQPRRAVLWMVEEALALGVKVAVDAASVAFLEEVGVETFLKWIGGCSLLFANGDEAVAMTGTEDPEAQMRFLGQYAEGVVLKRGRHGAAIGGKDGTRAQKPAAVVTRVVDTTGAGDAFAAGFISADWRGESEEACLAAGIAAAARAIGSVGGQPG